MRRRAEGRADWDKGWDEDLWELYRAVTTNRHVWLGPEWVDTLDTRFLPALVSYTLLEHPVDK